jgi:hypothetical protein
MSMLAKERQPATGSGGSIAASPREQPFEDPPAPTPHDPPASPQPDPQPPPYRDPPSSPEHDPPARSPGDTPPTPTRAESRALPGKDSRLGSFSSNDFTYAN